MVRQSNLKLDENIGNYELWRINKWLKENGIAELVDYFSPFAIEKFPKLNFWEVPLRSRWK
jgi:hypothetical protein